MMKYYVSGSRNSTGLTYPALIYLKLNIDDFAQTSIKFKSQLNLKL
jgi:hypothetical protein